MGRFIGFSFDLSPKNWSEVGGSSCYKERMKWLTAIFLTGFLVLPAFAAKEGGICWVDIKGTTYQGTVTKNKESKLVCRVVVGGVYVDVPEGKFKTD